MTARERLQALTDRTRRVLDFDLARAITVRDLAGLVVLWAAYVFATAFVAFAITRDPGARVDPGWFNSHHGYITDLARTPPLARWDSIWYLSIATEGYPGPSGEGIWNVSFMPLYGLAMRVVARAFAIGPLLAGIYVSRAALLVTMVVLFAMARDRGHRHPWAAVVALLAFPSAYILVAVYSESLFFALLVLAWWLAERKHWLLSAVAACLAALTRLHVFALAPGLFVLALGQWWPERRRARALLAFLPAIGAGAAVLALGVYSHAISGDWFLILHRKARFGMTDGGPLEAYRSTMVYFPEALRGRTFGNMYTLLEGPMAVTLAALTVGLLATRRWAEALFVVLCLTMNLRAGSLWGLPRYSLFVFPLWLTIGRTQRWPGVFHGYVVVGLLWQVCLMMNYVNARGPAP